MAERKTEIWNEKNANRARELLTPEYLPEELEAYLIDRVAQDFPLMSAGNIAGLSGSTYTPTLTQSGTVAKTVNAARYIRLGRLVHLWLYLTPTAAGTGNNSITVSLPITAATAALSVMVGTGVVVDTGTAAYPAHWYLKTATTIAAQRVDTGGTSDIGVDPNFALASGDVIKAVATYEAA